MGHSLLSLLPCKLFLHSCNKPLGTLDLASLLKWNGSVSYKKIIRIQLAIIAAHTMGLRFRTDGHDTKTATMAES